MCGGPVCPGHHAGTGAVLSPPVPQALCWRAHNPPQPCVADLLCPLCVVCNHPATVDHQCQMGWSTEVARGRTRRERKGKRQRGTQLDDRVLAHCCCHCCCCCFPEVRKQSNKNWPDEPMHAWQDKSCPPCWDWGSLVCSSPISPVLEGTQPSTAMHD